MKLVLSIIIFWVGIKYQNSKFIQTIELAPNLFAYTDYIEGVKVAKKEQKPVVLYFKDRRSSNCKKFEKNIFADDKIKNYLNKNFVVIYLLVDDTSLNTQKELNIKTKGEYNFYIEKSLFNSDLQPYVVLLNKQYNFKEGKGYTSDKNEFLKFLKTVNY